MRDLEVAPEPSWVTPFYAGYRFRPRLAIDELVAQFSGEPARFLEQLLAQAKAGRT